MRIVSQRRNFSINFDNADVEVRDNFITCIGNSYSYVIGEYKSEERAREVFEEMHRYYTGMPILFKDVDDEVLRFLEKWKKEFIIAKADEKSGIEIIDNNVFYMPVE